MDSNERSPQPVFTQYEAEPRELIGWVAVDENDRVQDVPAPEGLDADSFLDPIVIRLHARPDTRISTVLADPDHPFVVGNQIWAVDSAGTIYTGYLEELNAAELRVYDLATDELLRLRREHLRIISDEPLS